MKDYLIFETPETRRKKKRDELYSIGNDVGQFFWYDAPDKYGLENREGQQEMAFEILESIKEGKHIAIEAGVGIGKSFAYLVPLLNYNKKTGNPVIIATSTIALQEQLLGDVERLKEPLNVNPDIILAKGQTHYLCLIRLDEYLSSAKSEIHTLIKASIKNGCQDRRSFPFSIPEQIWKKINITRFSKRSCSRCVKYYECQYYRIRENLSFTKGIILCNQDFLTAHLFKLRNNQEGLINELTEIVVVDEAHNLEDKVRSATTERFGQQTIIGTINSAWNAVRPENREYLRRNVSKIIQDIKQLYKILDQQVQRQINDSKNDMKYADRFFFYPETSVVKMLKTITSNLDSLSDSVQTFSAMTDWENRRSMIPDDLISVSNSFNELISTFDNKLIWLEKIDNHINLTFCPKNTRNIINELYFSDFVQTILTSATLTNTKHGDVNEQYSYFLKNTGFPDDETGMLSEPKPSPFSYDQHAMIYYCDDLPHPTNEHEIFIEQGIERLVQILDISYGKALVLFTAKTDMEEVYAALQTKNLPYKILIQQSGSSQENVLNEFRDNTNSVLLGTGAYWEGIDIKGKSLSNLVIFRLPFPVRDPIIDYKTSIAKDPLMEVFVPEMIIKLKQGIGRLIRNFTDTGIVSIIDSRLRDNLAERYYDIVWKSLPIKNRTTKLIQIKEFYERVCRIS